MKRGTVPPRSHIRAHAAERKQIRTTAIVHGRPVHLRAGPPAAKIALPSSMLEGDRQAVREKIRRNVDRARRAHAAGMRHPAGSNGRHKKLLEMQALIREAFALAARFQIPRREMHDDPEWVAWADRYFAQA